MSTYSLSHLSDQALLAGLTDLVAADRRTTAALLAHLAEVDARALYLPAACPSMHAYCMRRLHLPEDVAFKRIRAARAARRFPQIFLAVADGRLHLTAVVLLAPHLTVENADELLAAAAHMSKADIDLLLAHRAPRPDLPAKLEPLPPPPGSATPQVDPDPPAAPPPAPAQRAALAPQRFALQLTIDQDTQDKLLRAQALLRHRVPSGDLAQVLDRALDSLLATLERQKFGAAARPRAAKAPDADADPRYVPNHVKRAVHARDGEQCAFVSDDGTRCTERGFLERDHTTPVARGGQPTVRNLRTLCRSHNRYEAERIFGTAFVQSRRNATAAPAPASPADSAPTLAANARPANAPELDSDALRALCGLGFKATEARSALAKTAHLPATTLEQRLRPALAALHPTRAGRCSEPAPVRWQTGPRLPIAPTDTTTVRDRVPTLPVGSSDRCRSSGRLVEPELAHSSTGEVDRFPTLTR